MKKIIFILFIIFMLFSCKKANGDENKNLKDSSSDSIVKTSESKDIKYKVTFIEIGSVKCIPCKAMQPVMKQIEEKFKSQVKVVFYDVWTEKEAPRAQEFGIRVIPTQVFLDADGKEFFRHEGYFPFEELEKILLPKL
jgi:thioredoxin 1